MSWEPEVTEIKRRKKAALAMGGEKNVKRQHDAGRLTIRERVDRLLDKDTFHEVGGLAGSATYNPDGSTASFAATNVIYGRGKIDGRPVVLAGDDFTMRGGSAEAGNIDKLRHTEMFAKEYRLPLIRVVEGSGGGGSVRTFEEIGRTYMPGGNQSGSYSYLMADAMATVPVVALGLGPIAGLGAARMVASHYSVMVRDQSSMFIAGPPLVARAGGGKLTKEELGGAKIHVNAGAIDDAVDTEDEAFERARRFLSYLPSSVYDLPTRIAPADDTERRDESLLSIVPRERRKVYAMRKIIESVVDKGSFFEMGKQFGRSIITGFARVDGWPVALMAGDPMHYGGSWTAAAAQKIIRFVDLAGTFHLPMVNLYDCPGFKIGLDAEMAGTVRHATRAVFAICQYQGPWCSVIIRNCFGLAGGAHQPQGRLNFRYAWPSARWGSLPLEGGVEAAYKSEIEAAADPKAKLVEIEARLEALQSPLRTAETYDVEDIIDPRDTRPLLAEFVNLTAPLRPVGPASWGLRP